MTESELFIEGINLMFAGMGFVMIFLILLIFAIMAMSKIINHFTPPPIATPSPVKQTTTNNDLDRLRPAIIAAVLHHHQQTH